MANPLSQFFKWSALGSTIVIIAVILVIMDGFVRVPPGHVAVIYDLGQGVLEEERPEGLSIKIPFWQKAYLMDVRTQAYTMSIAPGEGEIYNDDSIQCKSKDGQDVFIDATILYHINPAEANVILKTLGSQREYKEKIVRPKARTVIREVVAQYKALDLVSEKRAEVAQLFTSNLKEDYESNNIVLEEVALRNVSYSVEFSKTIEEKQIAEQKVITAQYKKQEAEQLKEKKIIEAQADAEAIRLKGETLRATPEVIKFEFVQKMAPNIKWGLLPQGMTPILDFGEMF